MRHFSVGRFITITTRFIILISLGFYGVLYPDKKSSAYSICKLSIASGEAIAFAYGNYLCQRTKVFIIMCYYVVGMLFFRQVYHKHKKNKVSNK